MEFFVTFGQQYPREPHPRLALAHKDGWVTIEAENYELARLEAFRVLGGWWSNLYEEKPDAAFYPLGELLCIFAPRTE